MMKSATKSGRILDPLREGIRNGKYAPNKPYPIDGANARKAIDLISRIYAQA